MPKKRFHAQNQSGATVAKRRRTDLTSRKYALSPFEALERDFIEIGEMDVDKLVLAAKSIFDSARRCLKGGKKRRVIQWDNKEAENAGVGWKVNFRTIMKHIREKSIPPERDQKLGSKSQKLAELKTQLDKRISSKDIESASAADLLISVDQEPSLAEERKTRDSSLKSINESTMRKIWDCLSYSRCFPMNENEMKELKELEVNKYIHYSLPKNEWYFGKFWFNKTREDIINELDNRRKGRYMGNTPQSKSIVATRQHEENLKRESLAVLTELKMQIMQTKVQPKSP